MEVVVPEAGESKSSQILRWMEIPRHPNVFALGNFARQVTFASQQTRAFNLIWALCRENRIQAGSRVGIVGAGLAGMTATVAALAKQCEVHLFEKASQPCPLQRGNDIRFVHPNILSWPAPGSMVRNTDFPFLNWTAANVRGVIKQILLQWERDSEDLNLSEHFNYKVDRLYSIPSKSGPRRPWITANRIVDGLAPKFQPSVNAKTMVADRANKQGSLRRDNHGGFIELECDCIILAVGFGDERVAPNVPPVSYWENDSLHQEKETGRGRKSVLISGCGDGGLIDALRLRLQNFDHADFVRRFESAAGGANAATPFTDKLRAVDDLLLPLKNAPDISRRFQGEYERIAPPEGVIDYFRESSRWDTTVTLNSPSPGPLSFQASLLNRYATFLAMQYADLHYVAGEMEVERNDGGRSRVTLRQRDTKLEDKREFDLIVVRHGPQSAIQELVPKDALDELKAWWDGNRDITTEQCWRSPDANKAHEFFRGFSTDLELGAMAARELALETFDSAYSEYSGQGDSIGIGEYEGRTGFIVRLKPGAPPRPTVLFAGVPVHFIPAPSSRPTAQAEPGTYVAPGARLIALGAGIYNYDASDRYARARGAGRGGHVGRQLRSDLTSNLSPTSAPAGDAAETTPSVRGTLGFFASDSQGHRYLVTAGYVLIGPGGAVDGDRIFLDGQSPPTHAPIATLARRGSLPRMNDTTDSAGTTEDVVAARLEADVVPAYPADGPAPRSVASAALGDRVTKIGSTSGLTRGKVGAISMTVAVMMSTSEQVWLKGCFSISADDRSWFSLPGDGGALIVRERDRAGLGLLFASSGGTEERPGVTIACSLTDVLKSLDLGLLRESGVAPSPVNAPAKKKKRQRSRPVSKTSRGKR